MNHKLIITKIAVIHLIFICAICSCTRSSDRDFTAKKIQISGFADSVHIVMAGDIVGSNKDELVAGRGSLIYIYDINSDTARILHSITFPEEIMQMHIGDADNDGMNELVIGTGIGGYVDKSIKIYIVEYGNGEWNYAEVYSKFSPRPQPTFLDIADIDNDSKNEIIASYFESKYIIETVTISKDDGEWKSGVHEVNRMATVRDIGILPGSSQTQEVVGRVYGDSSGANGDAYILDGSKKIMLPTYRGIRSAVTIGDGNNNGENEIYLGDGWHQNYGKIARARLAMIDYENDNDFEYQLIEDVKGQYEITQIEIADVTGDRKNEVITRGNMFLRIYKFDNKESVWKVFADTTIGTNIGIVQDRQYGYSNQFTIGDINGDGYTDVIFNGMQFSRLNDVGVQVYNFANLDYSFDLATEVLTEDVDPESLIGKSASELKIVQWYNGNFPGIKESKGKVILLDFWATWCAPCKKMFPKLRLWQEKYGKDGLVILGLTKPDRSQTINKIEDFISKENFNYSIGISEESFNNISYGVEGIPHMVLIDKNGIVRHFEVGSSDGEAFEEFIKELLK